MNKERVFLLHILESIQRIEAMAQSSTREEFDRNKDLQDIVYRRLEIIGEAVKHLPEEIKKKYPEIPWKEIIGTRDILIHAYFTIDTGLIWDIALKRLPELKKVVVKLLETF